MTAITLNAKSTADRRANAVVVACLLLDAFIAGACAALYLVNRLLVTIMHRLLTVQAQAEILNVLDHLLPFYLGFGAALIVALAATLAALLWRDGQPRWLSAAVVALPTLAVAWLAASRLFRW